MQENLFFDGECMDFISRVGGVSYLTMFNSAWHSAHSGKKGSLNAAKLFWGYNSYQEAQLYVGAYFPGEVDVEYDPSEHVRKKDGRFVLPAISPYEKCMITRMFFHWLSCHQSMGLFLDRHRVRFGQILRE